MTCDFVAGSRAGNVLASNQKTKNVLGWVDEIPLSAGLRDIMAALNE